MLSAPGGTVTFVFTDIEGFTQAWEADPTRMAAAQAQVDGLLRAALEQHGGFVFKTVGAAFHAAFASASAALDAALDMQRAVRGAGSDGTPLRLRVAVHTGLAEQRDGDYFGPPLNRLARLLAVAHGGQTVLSRVACELVRDTLPDAVTLRDLGEHHLRDLAHPEQVYQVVAPDLEDVALPLRSLTRVAQNLPLQLTSFVGREAELARVQTALGAGRLLSLTGPGGTGKTRLALQAAAEMVDSYADGVWFVDLSVLTDGSQLDGAVARVLGLRDVSYSSTRQTLIAYLRERRTLLILDNCEHVVGPAAELAADLLASTQEVRLLATSREALHIPGEAVLPLAPLAVPEPGRAGSPGLDLATVARHAAVQLFVERAQAVRPDFAVTVESAPVVAQLCQRLDGIPLAIELAAARVRMMTPGQILERMDQKFRLLTSANRTAPARQHTIEAAIDWSHDLLTAAERTVFRRLAVFRGGWTLEAAEAVCQGPDVELWEVLDLLASLVDKSLVVADSIDGNVRYRSLEMVREYALDALAAAGETEAVQAAHRAYFLALAEDFRHAVRGPDEVPLAARLDSDHDNFRAAIDRAVAAGEAQAGLQLGADLWRVWYRHGHWSEGRQHLAAVLGLPAGQAASAERAGALNGAGVLAWFQGDYAAARAQLTESIAMCRSLGDERGAGVALGNLASVAYREGDFANARVYFEDSLALQRQLGDRVAVALLVNGLGNLAYVQGDLAGARARYEECLALNRQIGSGRNVAVTLGNLGNVAESQGDYAAARALHEESLALHIESGDQEGTALALGNLGLVATQQGDLDAARALYEESLDLRRTLGDTYGMAISLSGLGCIALDRGELARARTLLAESLTLRVAGGDQPGLAECLAALGCLAAAQDEPGSAAQLLGASAALRRSIGIGLESSADTRRRATAVASARDRLGGAAFDRAWAEGEALTTPDAVRLAQRATAAVARAGAPGASKSP